MNGKITHSDVLFGYSYSLAMPHFIANQSLVVDGTVHLATFNSHLVLVLHRIHCKTEIYFTVIHS